MKSGSSSSRKSKARGDAGPSNSVAGATIPFAAARTEVLSSGLSALSGNRPSDRGPRRPALPPHRSDPLFGPALAVCRRTEFHVFRGRTTGLITGAGGASTRNALIGSWTASAGSVECLSGSGDQQSRDCKYCHRQNSRLHMCSFVNHCVKRGGPHFMRFEFCTSTSEDQSVPRNGPTVELIVQPNSNEVIALMREVVPRHHARTTWGRWTNQRDGVSGKIDMEPLQFCAPTVGKRHSPPRPADQPTDVCRLLPA